MDNHTFPDNQDMHLNGQSESCVSFSAMLLEWSILYGYEMNIFAKRPKFVLTNKTSMMTNTGSKEDLIKLFKNFNDSLSPKIEAEQGAASDR